MSWACGNMPSVAADREARAESTRARAASMAGWLPATTLQASSRVSSSARAEGDATAPTASSSSREAGTALVPENRATRRSEIS